MGIVKRRQLKRRKVISDERFLAGAKASTTKAQRAGKLPVVNEGPQGARRSPQGGS